MIIKVNLTKIFPQRIKHGNSASLYSVWGTEIFRVDFKRPWRIGVLLRSSVYSGMCSLIDSFFRFHKTLLLSVEFESLS